MFYKLLVTLSQLYTAWMKKGFAHFGKNSIIKPILNTTNQHMISIGDNVNIGSFSWVAVSTHFGKGKDASKYKIRLKIGNNVDIGNNAFIVANNDIEIGDHVMTGPYIYISDHSHRYDNVEENLRDQPLTEGGYVKIDKNVFIGIRATIMANVTVGEHAVIGANAVVTKDVPAYTVVVGNPAKAIKKYDFKKKEWIKIK